MRLCVTTVVDSKYQNYIPLFIYCMHKSYPEYKIKLFTHGIIQTNILTALHHLKHTDHEIHEGLFDEFHYTKYAPISWRFVVPPEHYEEYENVYITDIDMMIVSQSVDLLYYHLNEMGETGLCYSNSLRNSKHWKGTESFTGLHFASKEWFERTEEARQKYWTKLRLGRVGSKREYDGHMLYLMAKESGLGKCKKLKLAERHHGIHLGNFRLFKTMVKLKKRMNTDKCLKWQEWQRDPLFRRICALVSNDPKVKLQLKAMDLHCKVVIK